MVAELPLDIDYRRLLADGGSLAGTISAQRLTRISGIFRPHGDTQARLELTRDDAGHLLASGDFLALIEAQCQRCLEWMNLELCAHFEVDVRAAGDDDDGAFKLHGERLDVVALIEDEIILACPMIPTHPSSACQSRFISEPEPPIAARENSFASLSTLLKPQR